MPQTFLAKDKHNHAIQCLKPGATQKVTVTTGSSAAIASAVGTETVVIRLLATTDMYIAVGSAPSATNSSMYLPGGVPEYFRVDQNAATKVAGLAVSADGTLFVTEMN